MASTKTIPGAVMRGRSPFPAGHFQGDIGKVEDAASRDGTMNFLSFQINDIDVIEADSDPGKRPHFIRIATDMEVEGKRGRKEVLMTADVDAEDEDVPWALRLAVPMLGAIAVAVDRARVTGTTGAVEMDDDLETFIEELRSGEFEGETVEFIVSHSPEKKDGKVVKGGRTFVNTQFVVAEEEEGDEGEDDDEGEDEVEEETKGRAKGRRKQEEEYEDDDEGSDDDEGDEGEEEEEEEEEEEPTPAPRRRKASGGPAKKTTARGRAKSLTSRAKGRKETKKSSGAKRKTTKRGSGKATFTRRKR